MEWHIIVQDAARPDVKDHMPRLLGWPPISVNP